MLQLTSISKSFGGVCALEGVSFELKAGEVHALVGENGAGKSTLIKIITGAVQADAGSMQVDGQVLEGTDPSRSRQRGIAAIYQQPVRGDNVLLGVPFTFDKSNIDQFDF